MTVMAPGTAADQAAELADRVAGNGDTTLGGYFAHRPAEVAAGAAALLGLPYGFGVHALDARKVAPEELGRRAAGAVRVVACNEDAAEAVATAGGTATLLRHGVDTVAFPAAPAPRHQGPTRLLAVGRFVEKKGFATLLAAVAVVDRDVHLRLVGDCPLR